MEKKAKIIEYMDQFLKKNLVLS